jgi:hypothetical protein
MLEVQALQIQQVDRALADDLIGQGDLPVPRVEGLGTFHGGIVIAGPSKATGI